MTTAGRSAHGENSPQAVAPEEVGSVHVPISIDEQDKMRSHMRFFVNGRQVFGLDVELDSEDTVHIVQALSGG